MRKSWIRQRRKISELHDQLESLRERAKRSGKHQRELTEKIACAEAHLQMHRELKANESSEQTLLNDRPLPGHQYGVRLIALCIELAKRIGFSATQFAIEKLFSAMGINQKVPSHDAIEQWTLRLGVGELGDTFSKDQRVVWMADHSSQIGKERILLIIGVAIEDLPPPGKTLSHDRMKVLAIVPGKQWKKEDVAKEYQRLAEKIGVPAYVLCDGATELRDPAKTLENDGGKTIVLGDLKHHAANLLEKEIGRTERFKEFLTEVGLTRNRVQQTELSHFSPPKLKSRSRFMNLGSLLRWSEMVLLHLENPASKSREGISVDRMEEKLGWLRSFASDLSQWDECQKAIDESLCYINRQGVKSGTSVELRSVLSRWLEASGDRPASRLTEKLLRWVSESERLVLPGDRTWLSTEILESLFGRFKVLERQHRHGGFTRLIAALPTLCITVDASIVRRRFLKVKADDLKKWLKKNLGRTLTMRRNQAYAEYRNSEPTPEKTGLTTDS